VHKRINAVPDQAIDTTLGMERMFCDEGTLLFKFLVSPSKEHMKAFQSALYRSTIAGGSAPLDWQQSKPATASVSACCAGPAVITLHVVEGVDEYYRSSTVGRVPSFDGLQAALKTQERLAPHPHRCVDSVWMNVACLIA
jgi:hypothetical protein